MKIIETFEYEEIKGFKFGYSPIGKPKLSSIIYYIDGLLIDTGHRKMSQDIADQIKHLPVEQIFITHHHEDHTGNLDVLQSIFDCNIFASQATCDLMKDPPPISRAQAMVWGQRPAYTDLMPLSGLIQTKNHTFQLIPVPGHAPDMMALYERKRQWLFSADLFLSSRIQYYLSSEQIDEQIVSLRRVQQLDYKALLCSHNPKLGKDAKASVDKKITYLENFYADVIRLYEKGYDPKAIMKSLNLKEEWFLKWLSRGMLSKVNMVHSAIKAYNRSKSTEE